MLRRAAFAARVVASMPIVLPLIRSAVASTCRTPVKTVRGVSTSINRRVREIVECSGGVSSRPRPRKPRRASESAGRHAMPRSESMPSKYPLNSNRKYVPGVRLGRPTVSA